MTSSTWLLQGAQLSSNVSRGSHTRFGVKKKGIFRSNLYKKFNIWYQPVESQMWKCIRVDSSYFRCSIVDTIYIFVQWWIIGQTIDNWSKYSASSTVIVGSNSTWCSFIFTRKKPCASSPYQNLRTPGCKSPLCGWYRSWELCFRILNPPNMNANRSTDVAHFVSHHTSSPCGTWGVHTQGVRVGI